MKKVRKVLAALLALFMLAPMALATQGQEDTSMRASQSSTMTGVGTYLDPSAAGIWKLEFPTAAKVAFSVDPLNLAKSAKAYGEDMPVSDDPILFANYGTGDERNAIKSYKGTSSPLEVINKGTTDITVELNVRPTNTNMKYKTAALGSSDNDVSIAFQVVAGSSDTYTFTNNDYIPVVGKTITADVNWKAEAFKTTQERNGTIKYQEDGEKTGNSNFKWNSASFQIKGDAGTSETAKQEWTMARSEALFAPNLELTWNVRAKSAPAIPVEIKSNMTGLNTNYTMAADCIKAVPGQTVHVYVKPKEPTDAEANYSFVVTGAPSKIMTATKNYETGVVSVIEEDKGVKFGNGVAGDNGTMVYSFTVPTAKGLEGFSLKYMNTATPPALTDGNKIEITGAPEISKMTKDTTLDSSDLTG